MKEYDTGLNPTVLSAIVIAVVVVGGLFAATMLIPPGVPTTTPTNTNPSGSYGIRAADYLNNRRDDVDLYWMFNSSFVNVELSDYYDDAQSGAFVDGVKMTRTETGGDIEVLFSPWDSNIIGNGSIGTTSWESLGGNLIDGAIAQMADNDDQETGFPNTWPVDFIIQIFFDDGTFFFLGYTSTDQMVCIQNGTWSGSFMESGWPEVTGYSEGYNLNAGGLLESPIQDFYSTITQNVQYPNE